MVKKLTKHGNNFALILDKPLLELLKINEGTDLELQIEDGNLVIKPIKRSKSLKKSATDKIADRVIKKYEPVLRKLAKT